MLGIIIIQPSLRLLKIGGTYSLELVAKIVGRESLLSLGSVELEIPKGVYGATVDRETTVFFNWCPEQHRFVSSIENRSGAVHAPSDPQT
jgi:hypothetical protein